MANKIPRLLAPAELLDIYGIPVLSDIERQEYFTFNEEENKALKEFKDTKEAVYFAICLVFFKIKRTLVDFNYQDVTAERQHVMERYFPQVSSSIPRFKESRSSILVPPIQIIKQLGHVYMASERLEPDDAKVSCPVLMGLGGGNTSWLPGSNCKEAPHEGSLWDTCGCLADARGKAP